MNKIFRNYSQACRKKNVKIFVRQNERDSNNTIRKYFRGYKFFDTQQLQNKPD